MTFSDFQDFFQRAVTGVQVAKLLWDHKKENAFQEVCAGCRVDEDCEHMTVVEALYNICDHVIGDDGEEEDVGFFYFSDRTMMDYFRLCREYARMKKIPFEECPPVKEAEAHIWDWLGVTDCYYCGYALKTDTEKSWGCGIRFEYDVEYFWEYYPLLQRMLEALAFFPEKLPALGREVDALKRPFAIVPYVPKGGGL